MEATNEWLGKLQEGLPKNFPNSECYIKFRSIFGKG